MNILEKIVEQKKIEIEKMPLFLNVEKSEKNFKRALKKFSNSKSEIKLIAEIKKASPSNPSIFTKEFDPVKISKNYEKFGADCISILTDKKFFKGDFDYLEKVSKAVKIPCLCKDFIISEKQIYFARKKGADAILLISAILSVEKMQKFLNLARKLGMDAICEVHNEEELEKILKTDGEIIGINNRNLKTFEINLQTTLDLAEKIKNLKLKNKIIISESGIYDFGDVQKISGVSDGILVGTSIMQAKSMNLKIKELKGKKFLKICGIREKLKTYNGIDLLGFNFVKNSKRKISIKKTEEIFEDLKIKNTNISSVALFQNQEIEEIVEIGKKFNFDFIQLHGDESLDFCEKIKNEGFGIIKAFKVDENFKRKIEPFLEKKGNYSSEKIIDYFIFDSGNGGTGENFDEKFLKGIKIPYILAGGISENNFEIMLKNHPFAIGIDTASGAENFEKTNICEEKIFKLSQKKIINSTPNPNTY